MKKKFSLEEAKIIGNQLCINREKINPEQFRMGLKVELEHGKINPDTNVTFDDLILTGKIALAHLNEFPDNYDRLRKMEKEAKIYLSTK